LIAALCAGCGTDPYAGVTTATSIATETKTDTGTNTGFNIPSDYYVVVAPTRKLDLVFMIDNSPGMAPKVSKMNAQFPKLLAELLNPSDATYPDLRIAIIDSDLGTGGAYDSGSCGPNDSNGQSLYGDVGNFQMKASTLCGMKSADSLWIEYSQGAPVNYDGNADAINNVFACLATNTGTVGCGEEHSLQAFQFALLAQNLHVNRYAAQNSFLRPEAYLGLVFLTDEDDCSAATNDGMFGDKPELQGESASLRCATRGHRCNGYNLTDRGAGYPTTAAFTTDFTSCVARTDSCPNATDSQSATDTSVPTTCSPLKNVNTMADTIKGLKGADADAKIVVAGIFGWPRNGAAGEPYKIDLVPNPNTADTAHPQVFDYWPVCYDPDHMPTSSGFDQDAWGYGAMGGLRLAAFVDAFGSNGLKYSICERDFSNAMHGIGGALASRMLQNSCVPSNLEVGKTCTANLLRPVVDSTTTVPTVTYVTDVNPTPKCEEGAATVAQECFALVSDQVSCPATKTLVQIRRSDAEIAAGAVAEGTKLRIRCQ
jgi:hypothetical protein